MVPFRTIYFFFTVDSYPYYSELLPKFKTSSSYTISVIF